MKKIKSFFGRFKIKKKKKAFELNTSNIVGLVLLVLIIVVIAIVSLKLQPRVSKTTRTIDFNAPFQELSKSDLSEAMYARYQDAMSVLEEDDINKAALLNLGYIYRSVEEFGESEKAFKRYLDKQPDDAEALLGLARIYTDQGRYKDAETKYYEITTIYPLYTLAYKNLLELYKEKKLELNQKFVSEITDARLFDENNVYDTELLDILQNYLAIPGN